MDRQVLGVLKTTLQHDLGWNEIDYGNLVFAFQAAYAVGMVVVGRLVDRLGTRLGYALAMVFWSLASMGARLRQLLHQLCGCPVSVGFRRVRSFSRQHQDCCGMVSQEGAGAGDGNFQRRHQYRRHHHAPGGAVDHDSHGAGAGHFIITGALGFVWLIFWLLLYRKPDEHPRVSKAELDYIRSDPQTRWRKSNGRASYPHRQTWAFVVGKFMTDPIWWFYLFWIPDFLQRKHGLSLMKIGLPIVVIYVIADVGQRRRRLAVVVADPSRQEREFGAQDCAC